MTKTAYKYDDHGMFFTTGITQTINGKDFAPVHSLPIAPALKDGCYYMVNETKDGWVEHKIPATCNDLIGLTIKHQDLSPYANMIRERMNTLTASDSNYRVQSQGEGADEIRFVEKIPEPTFEELKAQKEQELSSKAASFENNLNKDMYFTSSLGFKVNGDRRTRSNIEDLITFFDAQAIDGTVTYRDYENIDRKVTKEQLQIMLAELIENCNNLYAIKWRLQAELAQVTTKEQLDKFVIEFPMMDFTVNATSYL